MNKEIDVVAIGEILIDFTPAGKSELGFPVFECNPGGAQPNVLTSVNRLGGKSAMIGKVGNDAFGKLLVSTLNQDGINTSNVCIDKDIPTTLAFVTLDDTGNRDFTFVRKPGADIMLEQHEVNENLIASAKVLQHGSLSCTDEPSKSATLRAINIAKKHGLIISYDPNLRLSLWKNTDVAKKTILELMESANIVKISNDEFEFLTGEKDYEKHSESFMKKYTIDLLFVTLGPKGAFFKTNNHSGTLLTYDVKVEDTTGSGDSFTGACLYKICQLKKPINEFTKTDLEDMVDFANASGSMAATKKGGIPSIPDTESILDCMKNIPKC